jgi:hypothetical protein
LGKFFRILKNGQKKCPKMKIRKNFPRKKQKKKKNKKNKKTKKQKKEKNKIFKFKNKLFI